MPQAAPRWPWPRPALKWWRSAKAGFAEQFKVLTLAAGTATPTPMRAMLIGREAAQTIAAVETGGTATGTYGVKVTSWRMRSSMPLACPSRAPSRC